MTNTARRTLRVALAGQPNVGKSTLFNLLTGLDQHVGNWPGKTVEQKAGTCQYQDWDIHLVDLPGTYSLSANSPEELVAREYIIRDKPDLVVAVVNAAALERSLYLVAELLPLPSPVIIALNMLDVAEDQGMKVEPHVLEAALGIPVVPIVASKGSGVRDLLERIREMACDPSSSTPNVPDIRADHKEVLEQIEGLLTDVDLDVYPRTWLALKVLEGDRQLTEMLQQRLAPETWQQVHQILLEHEDACIAVAGGRYAWIGRMIRAAVVRPRAGPILLTDRLDNWATHPLWGVVILLAVLALTFWLTYAVGTPLQQWVDAAIVQRIAHAASARLGWAPAWLSGLLIDGAFNGVATVASFFPILVMFFAVMGLLEDIGYMARGAYVMDRFMHAMGLHGKSFLPLFLGFGCNVPAVMGARVIEVRKARLMTILLAPLVPCTGRMAVVAFLAPAFFLNPTLVSWGLIGTNILVLAVTGIIMGQTVLRGEPVAFIMELPLYHWPNWRTIAIGVWHRVWSFLHKAGTVILVVSVIVWALSSWPAGAVEESLLGRLGRLLEPIGKGVGFDWRIIVALLSSFVAKENSIATLAVLFGAREGDASLLTTLQGALSPASALAFLVVQMLFIPCVATVAAIRQETASWRWTAFSVAFLTVLSFAGGWTAYQLATLLAP